MTRREYEETREFIEDEIRLEVPRPDALFRGGIIGAVTVTDVVLESESPWFFGPRGLVLACPEAINPIPASGALGYFTWKEGGDLDAPKPWMRDYPSTPQRPQTTNEPAPMPLFT